MNSTRPVGRPPKLTEVERQEVYEAFEQYIRETDDPTVVGFCATHQVAEKYQLTRDNLNDWTEFSTLVKRALVKQEHHVVSNTGVGKYNATFAIFRLKQPAYGWRDQSQVDQTVEVQHKYEDMDDEQLAATLQARKDRVTGA